jgi:hypothetical protein
MIRSQGDSQHTAYSAMGCSIDLLLFYWLFLPFKEALVLAIEGAAFSFQ